MLISPFKDETSDTTTGSSMHDNELISPFTDGALDATGGSSTYSNFSFWMRVSNDEFLNALTPDEARKFSQWMSTATTDLEMAYLKNDFTNVVKQSKAYRGNPYEGVPFNISEYGLDELHELLWNDVAPAQSSCSMSKSPPCCGGSVYTHKWSASPVRTARNSIDLLKSRGIRSIAMFGDSILGQWLTSFLYMLQRENVHCASRTVEEVLSSGDSTALNLTNEVSWALRREVWNCNGFQMWRLDRYTHKWLGSKGADDDPLAILHKLDIDAFAIGHGFHQHNHTRYREEIGYIVDRAKVFINTPRVHDGGKRLVIMRETSAQHFNTRNGDGSYENRIGSSCQNFPASTRGWRNDILNSVVAGEIAQGDEEVKNHLVIEHFNRATKDRYDAHVRKIDDCTHFCYCPLFWEGVFTSFYDDLDAWEKRLAR